MIMVYSHVNGRFLPATSWPTSSWPPPPWPPPSSSLFWSMIIQDGFLTVTAPRDQQPAISAFKKKPVRVISLYQYSVLLYITTIIITTVITIIMITIITTVIIIIYRWSNKAVMAAMEQFSNNLRRRKTPMDFHIQRWPQEMIQFWIKTFRRRFPWIEFQFCFRSPTMTTNSKFLLMLRTTSEFPFHIFYIHICYT